MKRREKIDLFLEQIQWLSQNYVIDSKQVYAQLIMNGVDNREGFQDLSCYFDSFISNNRNNSKTSVFVDPNWSYFCQFKSKGANKVLSMNPIKIYIPLKRQNIEQNIQKIFNFIDSNNIEHCSKIASDVRIDDLVIRVTNPNDADKIINFINSDNDLVNDMYDPNPFSITNGKIGLTMDRMVSYNSTLSDYIFEYINDSNSKNVSVTSDEFLIFLQRKLNLFHTKDGISDIKNRALEKGIGDIQKYLQSLEEVTNIIIGAINGFDKDSLYQYFFVVNSDDYNRRKEKDFSELDNLTFNNDSILFNELVSVMYNKYGDDGIGSIYDYFRTADPSYITRTNNLRDRVLFSETFLSYIRSINIFSEAQKVIYGSKESILEMVCKESYFSCQTPERNYSGRFQIPYLLRKIQVNDYSAITRNNNARTMAENNILPDEVMILVENSLRNNGYEIDNNTDLYKLYTDYIEYKCMNEERRRNR